eukprot:6181172-Pleurochrysis_carterae.AAC.3
MFDLRAGAHFCVWRRGRNHWDSGAGLRIAYLHITAAVSLCQEALVFLVRVYLAKATEGWCSVAPTSQQKSRNMSDKDKAWTTKLSYVNHERSDQR